MTATLLQSSFDFLPSTPQPSFDSSQQQHIMSMFTLSQHQYAFAQAPPPARQYAAHGTSSAFSSSANPDEDWTKISDLAERRRIQNRIAQRNYRKKLKRRLEDLERRAGSSDDGESDKPTNTSTTTTTSKTTKRRSPSKSQPKTSPAPPQHQQIMTPMKPSPAMQFTPPMEPEEMIFPSHHNNNTTGYERERSFTPPLFSYATYPAPDEQHMLAPYSTAPSYQVMSSAEPYPSYLSSSSMAASPLPSLSHFSDALKREPYPMDSSSLTPYVGYGYVPGVDITAANHYDGSNPHTPPLSHSFDHSANCSEAGYEYPTTPLSMPGSPGMVSHLQ